MLWDFQGFNKLHVFCIMHDCYYSALLLEIWGLGLVIRELVLVWNLVGVRVI